MEIIAILLIVGLALIIEQRVYVKLALRNVTYTARFSTSEAMEGETLEIIEEIVNDKGLPVPWIKTELCTSRWLEFSGTQASRASDTRFVPSVFSLRPRQKCTRTRTVKACKRGNFDLESVSIVASDLLGLVTVSRALKINESIRILPAPWEVNESPLSQEEFYGETVAKRFICDDPFLISGAREYTGREPMNRIHWNSTAKASQLMVFNNDHTTQNRAAVIMNMQRNSNGEPHPLLIGDTETYIKAAAFIFEALAAVGAEFDFHTNGSGGIHEKGGSEKEAHIRLLRVLADIVNECDIAFDIFLDRAVRSGLYFDDRTDIIILTAYIDDRMTDFASLMRRRGKNVVFYCNDDSADDPKILRIGRVGQYY